MIILELLPKGDLRKNLLMLRARQGTYMYTVSIVSSPNGAL